MSTKYPYDNYALITTAQLRPHNGNNYLTIDTTNFLPLQLRKIMILTTKSI